MNKLKQLQKDYQDGKITKDEYLKQAKQLKEDGEIEDEDYQDALDYDPKDLDPDEKAIYSQNDLDRIVKKKSLKDIRKVLRDAGVELDGVSNQQLQEKLVALVQAGTAGDSSGDADVKQLQTDLTAAQKKAEKLDEVVGDLQSVRVENAVLKHASKYKPVNPNQVVRALNADYKELLEFDEDTGEVSSKSVKKAMKSIAEAEPNLFGNPTGEDEDDDPDLEQGGGNVFKGKGPGGGTGGTNKQKQKQEKLKSEALGMLGIKKDN